MDKFKKRELIELSISNGATLEDVPCSIGGWANDYATLAPRCGGFWNTSWETVKRVMDNGGRFIASDVTFYSWRWLGYGIEVPPRLKVIAGVIE